MKPDKTTKVKGMQARLKLMADLIKNNNEFVLIVRVRGERKGIHVVGNTPLLEQSILVGEALLRIIAPEP